jgi:hypothetical protein
MGAQIIDISLYRGIIELNFGKLLRNHEAEYYFKRLRASFCEYKTISYIEPVHYLSIAYEESIKFFKRFLLYCKI